MKKVLYASIATLFLLSAKAWCFDTVPYFAGTNMFVCASTATTVTTLNAGLTAGPTSLILVNPQGSGVNLVVLETQAQFTSSPAAASGLFWAYSNVPYGSVTSTVPGTISTASVGLSTGTFVNSQAGCYVKATFSSTPTMIRLIGGTTGASAIGGVQLHDISYPPGSFVIPPGGAISLQSTSAAGAIADVVWWEIKI